MVNDSADVALDGMACSAMLPALAEMCVQLGWQLGTAESCTGGGIAQCLTELPGASRWFKGGVVAYDNAVKRSLLHVSELNLETFGAVSAPVVAQMAESALGCLQVNCAVAVSGVAGPDGGSSSKPVGTVYLAWAWRDSESTVALRTARVCLPGARADVRERTVWCALLGLSTVAGSLLIGDCVPDWVLPGVTQEAL